MNGRIKALSNANGSGVIASQNGMTIRFELASVLAFDQAKLAVGKHVTFDIKDDTASAVNICLQLSHQPAPVEVKHSAISPLRYAGFDQAGSIRTYRFEWRPLGDARRIFFVTTDVSMFTRHHIGIQEGPALCLQLLLGEFNVIDVEKNPAFTRSLTESDIVAFVANKALLKSQSAGKRKTRAVNQVAHAAVAV